jgi:hypothetical protein
MSTSLTRRGALLVAAAAVSLFAALATASQAGATTYYACVKKSGGAHVFTKKPKCKSGESKLSWNSRGPAGKNGVNGLNGAAGKNGTNGGNGTNGQNLTSQTPLASGQSESGAFAVGSGDSNAGFDGEGISFAQPLPSPIAENHVLYNLAKTTTAQCPGMGKAAAGFVCMYESESAFTTFRVARNFNLVANAADPFGFSVFFDVKPGTEGFAAGVWTVTAG